MKYFNDLAVAKSHWKKHAQKETGRSRQRVFVHDPSCIVLIRRYNYLSKKLSRIQQEKLKDIIEEMEEKKTKDGKPYAIKHLMKNKLLPSEKDKFKGRSSHTKTENNAENRRLRRYCIGRCGTNQIYCINSWRGQLADFQHFHISVMISNVCGLKPICLFCYWTRCLWRLLVL